MAKVETYLSRNELTALLYDKLTVIQGEVEEYVHDRGIDARSLPDVLLRLKRIAIEAKRAACLIETHERVAKAGHCLHCGGTYEEHQETPPARTQAKTRASGDEPRCRALQQLFDSLEIETYQPLKIEVTDG